MQFRIGRRSDGLSNSEAVVLIDKTKIDSGYRDLFGVEAWLGFRHGRLRRPAGSLRSQAPSGQRRCLRQVRIWRRATAIVSAGKRRSLRR